MKRKNKILFIIFSALILLMLMDITITNENKYIKINSVFGAIFTDTPLIEKGIVKDEN
jgi:uncharacterized integral membrane protein